MSLFLTIFSWALIFLGSLFVIIGAIGLVRLPDFWSRLHGVSILDSAGIILIIAGMILHSGLTLASIKLVIIGLFLLITGPTASHAVANAAYVSGSRPISGQRSQTSSNTNEKSEGAD